MATIRASFGFGFGFGFMLLVFSVTSTTESSSSFLVEGADFNQWCQRTTNVTDCIAIIKGDPRNNLKTSPNGLCTILNDFAKKFAGVSVTVKITDLLNSRGWIQDPTAWRVLNSCLDTYNRIISGLNLQNYTELNDRTYTELNLGLGEIYDEAFDCESSFKPPNKSPLTVENQVFMSIIETIAEILNLNQCNQTLACV